MFCVKKGESEEIDHLKEGYNNFCDKESTFKNNDGNDEQFITLRSLARVAAELGEDISEEELKEMLEEADPELKAANLEF